MLTYIRNYLLGPHAMIIVSRSLQHLKFFLSLYEMRKTEEEMLILGKLQVGSRNMELIQHAHSVIRQAKTNNL